MIQGETITTTIKGFPFELSEISKLYIVFARSGRSGNPLVQKELQDCTVDTEAGEISFKLSQEESLSLAVGEVTRSIVVLTADGSRFESIPSPFNVLKTVKNEVI